MEKPTLKERLIKPTINYNTVKTKIEARIVELKNIDAEFCKERWDMTKPQFLRDFYRGASNEVTRARQELEALLVILDKIPRLKT